MVYVGRVSVVYWEGTEGSATAIGEMADAMNTWPGISGPPAGPIRIILAPNDRMFDSLTAGRIGPTGIWRVP